MTRKQKVIAEAVETLRNLGHSSLGDQLARFLPTTSPLSKKRKAASRAEKKATKQERQEAWQAIRVAVYERANGVCEVCGYVGDEVHHLLSGGLRRHRESVDTCLLLCRLCHRQWHEGDGFMAVNLLHAAKRIGCSSEAIASLQRRLSKLGRAA